MCGIAGYFGKLLTENTPAADNTRALNRMLETIAYRGPDGQGTRVFDQAGIGHVRLAVIDLEGGTQPMSTQDGRYHITYNGEIYNFREIRAKLRSQGHEFHTKSDTEVLLLAYQEYGIQAFSMLRGMFAFALWDDVKKKGLLVRDRSGIKPLFYTRVNNSILFGSEIKALLPVLAEKPDLDLSSLHLLFNFRYIPGDATLFQSVSHLPPGHYLQWHEGNYRISQWTENPVTSDGEPDIAAIRNTLQQAVHRQLVSDVPLGAYLSAGLDSSTLVTLALQDREQSAGRFPTFTIQTGDSPLEAQWAGETAAYLGVPNHQQPLDLQMETMLPWLIHHLEVPKVNAVQAAVVARLAKTKVKVALSGLGGDEIFLGYNIYGFLNRLESLKSGPSMHLARLAGSAAVPLLKPLGLKFEEYQRGCAMLRALPDFPTIYGILRNVWDSPGARRRIYGPRLLDAKLPEAGNILAEHWDHTLDPITAASGYEIEQKMVNDLLLQEDRLSMAFGLELRVPFLDEDLVSLMTGIRWRKRIPGGELKKLMREVIQPWIPEFVLNRPKSGFQVPIHIFFNTHLRPLCDHYLSRERLQSDGLFNPDFVAAVLQARPHLRLRWHYFLLYLMLGMTIWLDIFEQGKEAPEWN
ncbi:asparagine synthase (glutamine-hydrolyzing) [Thermodesulfobacteriota bacterium]